MIELDGSTGEGGGQVLRAALSLSMGTGRPFRMTDIRAGRSDPGLRRQHRTAVRAAAEITDARVDGDDLGSTHVEFRPGGPPRPGDYSFDTGGAGSAVLVLQSLLPALLLADGSSRVEVEGGTHSPASPPHEFLSRTWLPLLRETGLRAEVDLRRAGFHPAGRGRLVARSRRPAAPASPALFRRGRLRAVRARSHIVDLPRHVAERELATVQAMLDVRDDHLEVADHGTGRGGPANVLVVEVESETATGVFTEHGRRGLPAEEVAARASRRARRHLRSEAPVGPRLADQLPVPLALRAGGRYRIASPGSHTHTVLRVIRAFPGTAASAEPVADETWEVAVEGFGGPA